MINVEELINKIDLLEYCQQYLSFEEKNQEFFSVCPFHNENTASFSITPLSQLFYCFGCCASGNIINFIMQYHKLDFKSALIHLCKYAKIDINELPQQMEIIKTMKQFKKQDQKLKQVKHKILDKDIMNKYDDKLDKLKLWINEGISANILKKYQVKYDSFSNRICIPIWDLNGNIINIIGRTIDENYKEKKIQKYMPFYSWGATNDSKGLNTIYNYWQRKENYKEKNEIIIFEAQKSCLLAESYGITNTGALMGSHLDINRMRILCQLGVDVIFALDEDVSIFKDKNIQTLKRFCKIEYIWNWNKLMKEKESPIDNGLEQFLQLYEKRKIL